MAKYDWGTFGFHIPEIMLPKEGTDYSKWAVVACDQYTSEPEYWDEVEKIVGDAPSALRLMLPEIYLEKEGEAEKIQAIRKELPGIDCGSCGAPNCRAFAEDIVMANADKNDCIIAYKDFIKDYIGNYGGDKHDSE